MNNQDETVESILAKYKKSLSSWISRCNNELPPVNQKGRVISEIDAEAVQALARLHKQQMLDVVVPLMPELPTDKTTDWVKGYEVGFNTVANSHRQLIEELYGKDSAG